MEKKREVGERVKMQKKTVKTGENDIKAHFNQ